MKFIFKTKTFDQIIQRPFDNKTIEYGIIKGNNIVVFIKVGLDGSIYGYKNKYLQIATTLHNKYGVSVVVASNPFSFENPLDQAMEVINEYIPKVEEIYYMGHSLGALIGGCYAYKYPKIKRLLMVNSLLHVNFHKLKNGLDNFQGESVLISGEKDQSHVYIRMMDKIQNPNFKYIVIPNADHNFSASVEVFITLPERYLFTNINI